MLLEMEKIGQSADQPGVYGWSTEKGWRRVAVYGRGPRWSPQRDHFLYWVDGRPWLVDLANPTPKPLFPDRSFYDATWAWTPDGRDLVGRRDGLVSPQGDGAISRVLATLAGRPLYHGHGAEYAGRFTFSSDGRHCAYEALDPLPGLGASASVIRVATVGATDYHDVLAPALADCLSFNPKWQPNGPWLAFDVVRKATGQQEVVLWQSNTGELRQVLSRGLVDGLDWSTKEQARLVDWAPDGQTLMVWSTPNPGGPRVGPSGSASEPSLVPLSPGRPVEALGGNMTSGDLVCGAWSPDGQRVAIYRAHRRPTWASEASSLGIYGRSQAGRPGTWRYVEPPAGLSIVSMDW